MLRRAEILDVDIVTVVDGFCRHLQTHLRVPYGWMISSISIGTAIIGAAAAVMMFGADEPVARAVAGGLWLGCLLLMTAFFRRTLWLQMRKWPRDEVIRHWAAMAMVSREDGRPIRLMALFGTIILTISGVFQIVAGSPAFGLQTLRFLFVTMFPVTLMLYAFCALPVRSPTEDL